MADKYTYSQFLKDYPTDDVCLNTILAVRYGDNPTCHECKRETTYHRITKRRAYACQFCGAHVYPCAGTPFEKSTTSLHKWFFAMYLFTTSKHGVSGKELEAKLGVTYKCAWRMGHQIRKLMDGLDMGGLFGDVEIDETYDGGKMSGVGKGKWRKNKTVILGMKERSGPVKTQVIPDAKRATMEPIIKANVRQGSRVHTDELHAYASLTRQGYKHESVNHGQEQWTRGSCHTNSIEGYWSHIKRSIRGTHVHVSKKHMPKYLAEFDFRHNLRTMPAQMFHLLVQMLAGRPA